MNHLNIYLRMRRAQGTFFFLRMLTHQLCKYSPFISAQTHHLVIVVELQDNIRGLLSDVLGVSINLHIVENQSLVPGWVQCGLQLLCSLTEMQEGDVCIRICE